MLQETTKGPRSMSPLENELMHLEATTNDISIRFEKLASRLSGFTQILPSATETTPYEEKPLSEIPSQIRSIRKKLQGTSEFISLITDSLDL